MPHPDVARERARLRFAQECLEAMRERTASRVADEDVLAANEADAEAVKWQLQRRLASLNDDAGSLCFGRIDDEAEQRWYIGRRHVEDGGGAPVVVDWRADVATPFYRATLADPLGLHLRRRFVFNGPELADVFEEDFDDPDSLAGSGGVPDPLLAELGRARTGQMRDIVATIQGEQDTIIRAPLETCLVVQGGPGTGKTAVGLHRAAFLMYEHRARLARGGVLVVGPNPVFLRYISQVLPSLGETSATQTTVDGLLGLRFRVVAEDPEAVAAIKGDARMTQVVERAAADAVRIPADGITLTCRARPIRVSAAELEEMVAAVRSRSVPVTAQRERFRRALVHHAYDAYTRGTPLGFDEEELGAELLADAESRKAIDGCWRSVGAVALVKSLLTQRALLARAADGVLEPDEQARLLRPRAEADAWTGADLALLDEAEALLKGGTRQFDHVVVDEAQDLSPMQLRMLARRARRHSMTVLGDLAQATGPASPGSWDETLVHLGRPANAQTAELTMGYRLPGSVLALANRLLARAAPGVAPSRSVRPDGDPPDRHRVAADELVDQVAEHAVALVADLATVAVIAMPERVAELRAALEARGVALAELGEVDPDRPIAVVPAALAKGLEFDGVIVVEPQEIVGSGPHGVRLLFVALTRAVQHLAIAPHRSAASRARARIGSFTMSEALPRLRITRRSGNVVVSAEPGAALLVEGGKAKLGPDGVIDIRPKQGAKLEITCPAGTDLTISTDSGNVDVRGDAGSVKVITKSGSVSIEHATAVNARGASGRVNVGTCAGDCHVVFASSNVTVGEAERAVIATVSGNIDVDETHDAEVKTVSGNISLGARGGGKMAARSISGSVEVSVPDGSRPLTKLKAVSGRVRCEPQPGDDGEVKIKSVSGSISVTCR